MVFLEALADDAGALGIFFVVLHALAVHGREDAPVDGLEAVASVRQSAADNHRHRVVEVGAAHFLFDVDVGVLAAGRVGAFEGELWILIVWHSFFAPARKRQKTQRRRAVSAGLLKVFYKVGGGFRKTRIRK